MPAIHIIGFNVKKDIIATKARRHEDFIYKITSSCFRVFVVIIFLVSSYSASAQDMPTPTRKTEALSELKSRLEEEKSEQSALKKKMSSAEAQLDSSRKDLVSLTENLQTNEKTLTTLEHRIASATTEQATLQQMIEADYGSMSNLVLALQRIRRMPTETLIIRPGAPLETAQSALLLRSMLPAIHKRADQMAADLKRVDDLRLSLESDQAKASETATQMQAQKKSLQLMLDKREKLYRQTRSAYDTQAEAVARMAAEAQNLQQLVDRIDAEEQRIARAAKAKPQTQKASLKPPKLPGGRWVTPLQGNITTRFGENDDIGATSEGIRIAGRDNGLVSAPAGGVIRFAGPFRNYGNMVIIEHDQGFHSLMSGLSRMDVSVGRKISAGEPVGTLSGSGSGRDPALYYELRQNGKPVDPSGKFPDLSS